MISRLPPAFAAAPGAIAVIAGEKHESPRPRSGCRTGTCRLRDQQPGRRQPRRRPIHEHGDRRHRAVGARDHDRRQPERRRRGRRRRGRRGRRQHRRPFGQPRIGDRRRARRGRRRRDRQRRRTLRHARRRGRDHGPAALGRAPLDRPGQGQRDLRAGRPGDPGRHRQQGPRHACARDRAAAAAATRRQHQRVTHPAAAHRCRRDPSAGRIARGGSAVSAVRRTLQAVAAHSAPPPRSAKVCLPPWRALGRLPAHPRRTMPQGLAASALVAALLVPAVAAAAEPEDWNLRLQSTFVRQLKPAFASPYQGPNSLTGEREWSYSFTATAALGMRLGPDTEAYFDPEVAQGVAPSNLLGLAGFPNGELSRTSGPNPTAYRARLFVRHVIGLSDEREDIEPAMNQLGASYATRRLVLTAGNVSVLDIFDANRYANDPRSQFLNWALMTHAAYDYAADARGYTWGFAAEYVDSGWTLRWGRFAQPREPNQLELDPKLLQHFGDQVEVERRYRLGDDRPGTARLLAFRNRAVMARYDDALALADATGSVPDINAVRHGEQVKLGIGIDLEQQLSDHAGVFARAMWADGKTETYAFTDADRSLSTGLSIDGAAWGRGGDVAGLALARSLLSAPHREYLGRGGLTFFLGDGRLNYRPEGIVEAYYLWSPVKGFALSLDWQRIANPGFNADRGPATFWGVRLHAE